MMQYKVTPNDGEPFVTITLSEAAKRIHENHPGSVISLYLDRWLAWESHEDEETQDVSKVIAIIQPERESK